MREIREIGNKIVHILIGTIGKAQCRDILFIIFYIENRQSRLIEIDTILSDKFHPGIEVDSPLGLDGDNAVRCQRTVHGGIGTFQYRNTGNILSIERIEDTRRIPVDDTRRIQVAEIRLTVDNDQRHTGSIGRAVTANLEESPLSGHTAFLGHIETGNIGKCLFYIDCRRSKIFTLTSIRIGIFILTGSNGIGCKNLVVITVLVFGNQYDFEVRTTVNGNHFGIKTGIPNIQFSF